MSHLRIVQIEIEDGNDDVVRAALSNVFGRPQPVVSAPTAPISVPSAAIQAGRVELTPQPKKQIAAPAEAKLPREGSIGDVILSALNKKPMSSLELAEHLKMEPAQIYAPCSAMKGKGILESRIDESGDGTRRWYLAGN